MAVRRSKSSQTAGLLVVLQKRVDPISAARSGAINPSGTDGFRELRFRKSHLLILDPGHDLLFGVDQRCRYRSGQMLLRSCESGVQNSRFLGFSLTKHRVALNMLESSYYSCAKERSQSASPRAEGMVIVTD